MALLKMFKGTKEQINSQSINDGALYIATDTKELFMDNGTERIEIAATDLSNYITKTDANAIYATKSHSHAASDITSGTFSLDRIPTISDAKISGISASKITGTISSANLPSYVDDVLEGFLISDGNFYKIRSSDGTYSEKITGEFGKIYIDLNTNKMYRWSGSAYVEISSSGANVWKAEKTAGEFYKAAAAPTSTTVGKFDGYFYATRVYNAVWNDYAELFESSEDIEVGHIAYANDDGLVMSKGSPNRAIGVISDCWGHLIGGNGNPDSDDHVPIALSGRVPIEVRGEVNVGDMIAACDDGIGVKASFEDFGKIIGKCVGPDPKGRESYVNMLVSIM